MPMGLGNTRQHTGQDAILGLVRSSDAQAALGAAVDVHDGAVKSSFCPQGLVEIALQVHDDEAAEVKVIKEEVEEIEPRSLTSPVLAADKREAAAELEEKFLKVESKPVSNSGQKGSSKVRKSKR